MKVKWFPLLVRPFARRPFLLFFLGSFISLAFAFAFFVWLRPPSPPVNPGRDPTMVFPWRSESGKDLPAYDPASDPDRPFDALGIERPATLPADAVSILDEEPVIGVVAHGHSRAYLREALIRGADRHIVNDILADVPVSVTCCDLDDCVRGFAGKAGEPPLPLAQGGRRGGQMVLKIGNGSYGQRTEQALDPAAPPFPFAQYPVEKTTWGAWRKLHPDTDIYLGDIPPKPGLNRRPAVDSPLPLGPFVVVVMMPLFLASLAWLAIVWPRRIRNRTKGQP
jgi:hypothetical protein